MTITTTYKRIKIKEHPSKLNQKLLLNVNKTARVKIKNKGVLHRAKYLGFIAMLLIKKERINVAQQLLQRIWAIGLMEKWFYIWMFRDNRKINVTLVPNPL